MSFNIEVPLNVSWEGESLVISGRSGEAIAASVSCGIIRSLRYYNSRQLGAYSGQLVSVAMVTVVGPGVSDYQGMWGCVLFAYKQLQISSAFSRLSHTSLQRRQRSPPPS